MYLYCPTMTTDDVTTQYTFSNNNLEVQWRNHAPLYPRNTTTDYPNKVC